ncbi:MAG: hypothetical protein FWG47_06460 [Propionibacteriaceae bacterium]|nr:hypothetical protein [Propionibacteriaceae bacterium]
MGTMSLLLRVRRTITSDAFISVPITNAMMAEHSDGSSRMDMDLLFADGIAYAAGEGVDWQVEDTVIEVHPIQKPIPEDRIQYVPDAAGIDWAQFDNESIEAAQALRDNNNQVE